MSYHSLKPVTFDQHYVRHQNFLGELTPVRTYLDRRDASFWVQPGLADPAGVTFQSVNFPHHYLRHQHRRLHLSHLGVFDTDDLLNHDATFMPRAGLTGGAGTVSYEALNMPGHFLRHRDFHLWVERNDGSDLVEADATFTLVPALEQGPRINVGIERSQTGGEVRVSGFGWTTGEPLTILVYNAPDRPSPYEAGHISADEDGRFVSRERVQCTGTADPALADASVHIWCTNGHGIVAATTVRARDAWICPDAGV
jgi:hypothetical protein